jgi:YGGT family
MTYDERVVRTEDERVIRTADDPAYDRSTVVERRVTRSPGASDLLGRVIALLFGIVQVLIILRIVLLLLNAREGNDIVAWILNTSQIFVGPFEGMLNTNALTAGGSVLDVAAILALVGWTVLEALIMAAIGIFRRDPA